MGLTYVARQENGGKNGPFRRRMGRSWLVCGSLTLTLLAALPITVLSGFGTAAQAQQADVYSASGITVDLTGDIATLRDQALLQGQRQGLQKVISDIAPPDKIAGLALPDDATIGRWVQDFQIEDEKASSTHYIGRFTFRFGAQPIRDFLAEKGIDFAQAPSKRMLVVPIFTDETGASVLWSPNNQWLHAWAAKPTADGLVPIVTPAGNLEDSNAITATQALAGDHDRLAALAQRYGAGDILVTEAKLSPAGADGKRGLNIAVTRYGIDGTKSYKDSLTGPADGVDQMLAEGVDHVTALIGQSWKTENLLNPNQQNDLTLDVPLENLKQWIEVKKRLAGVNLLKGVKLISLKPSLAVLDVTYLGDSGQFARALAQNALTFTDTGSNTGTLALAAGATATPAPVPDNAPDAQPSDTAPADKPAVPDQPAVPQ
ncbi:MAG TPA: DUF2066 domain-containing protein [Dongiaceae bacterium]